MRRAFVTLAVVLAMGLGTAVGAAEDELPVNDAGLFTQPWFKASALDLRDDLRQAAAEGRYLALLWEQAGCPYCREMHRVAFRMPEIVTYIRANFDVVRLDLWGKRLVTGLDGERLREARLAAKSGVMGTPIIQFIDAEGREVARLPGYAEPFIFLSVFEYVVEQGYEKMSLRDWLIAKLQEQAGDGGG